jgi:transcriptional regulator with XRE-family HTH domain
LRITGFITPPHNVSLIDNIHYYVSIVDEKYRPSHCLKGYNVDDIDTINGMVMRETELRELRKAVGLRIKQMREARGKSRKALSIEAGYGSHSMLVEIEQGLQLPSYIKLIAIARVLDVSTDWLLGVEGAPGPAIDLGALAKKEACLQDASAQLRAVVDTLNTLSPLIVLS